jgi:hypothetical protein
MLRKLHAIVWALTLLSSMGMVAAQASSPANLAHPVHRRIAMADFRFETHLTMDVFFRLDVNRDGYLDAADVQLLWDAGRWLEAWEAYDIIARTRRISAGTFG